MTTNKPDIKELEYIPLETPKSPLRANLTNILLDIVRVVSLFVVLSSIFGLWVTKTELSTCVKHVNGLEEYPDYYIYEQDVQLCRGYEITFPDLLECNEKLYKSADNFHCE